MATKTTRLQTLLRPTFIKMWEMLGTDHMMKDEEWDALIEGASHECDRLQVIDKDVSHYVSTFFNNTVDLLANSQKGGF